MKKKERPIDDLLENDPQILARNFRAIGLILMQTEKRKYDRVFNELQQVIKKHNYPLDQEIGDFLSKLRKEDIFLAEKLEEANFWITPSINIDFLLKLQKISEQTQSSPKKIENAFLKHFKIDHYSNLKGMVKSWKSSSYFSQRIKIINDARDAHIDHKYSLSIPTLIPQIEGILSSLTGKPAGRPSKIFEEALLERYSDINDFMSKSIVNKLALGSSLYGGVPNEYFTPEKYSEWTKTHKKTNDLLINRHAILHGVQINYASASNSLRAFLLLDVVYWMSKE